MGQGKVRSTIMDTLMNTILNTIITNLDDITKIETEIADLTTEIKKIDDQLARLHARTHKETTA
jgi:hypothetical protein